MHSGKQVNSSPSREIPKIVAKKIPEYVLSGMYVPRVSLVFSESQTVVLSTKEFNPGVCTAHLGLEM